MLYISRPFLSNRLLIGIPRDINGHWTIGRAWMRALNACETSRLQIKPNNSFEIKITFSFDGPASGEIFFVSSRALKAANAVNRTRAYLVEIDSMRLHSWDVSGRHRNFVLIFFLNLSAFGSSKSRSMQPLLLPQHWDDDEKKTIENKIVILFSYSFFLSDLHPSIHSLFLLSSIWCTHARSGFRPVCVCLLWIQFRRQRPTKIGLVNAFYSIDYTYTVHVGYVVYRFVLLSTFFF